MSHNFTRSYAAPAAVNNTASIGKGVELTAVATGQARATLLAAATSLPLGIIVQAENMIGGETSVCVGGVCRALAGAAITPGTDNLLMCDATGRLIPATEGSYYVGRLMSKQVAAAGDWIEVYVQPDMFDIVDA